MIDKAKGMGRTGRGAAMRARAARRDDDVAGAPFNLDSRYRFSFVSPSFVTGLARQAGDASLDAAALTGMRFDEFASKFWPENVPALRRVMESHANFSDFELGKTVKGKPASLSVAAVAHFLPDRSFAGYFGFALWDALKQADMQPRAREGLSAPEREAFSQIGDVLVQPDRPDAQPGAEEDKMAARAHSADPRPRQAAVSPPHTVPARATGAGGASSGETTASATRRPAGARAALPGKAHTVPARATGSGGASPGETTARATRRPAGDLALLAKALDKMPHSLAVCDMAGRICHANQALTRLLPVRQERIAGMRITDLVAPPGNLYLQARFADEALAHTSVAGRSSKSDLHITTGRLRNAVSPDRAGAGKPSNICYEISMRTLDLGMIVAGGDVTGSGDSRSRAPDDAPYVLLVFDTAPENAGRAAASENTGRKAASANVGRAGLREKAGRAEDKDGAHDHAPGRQHRPPPAPSYASSGLELAALLERLSGKARQAARRAHILVRTAFDSALPPVTTQNDWLEPFLDDMISAVLATGQPGEQLVISARAHSGIVTLAMRDTGGHLPFVMIDPAVAARLTGQGSCKSGAPVRLGDIARHLARGQPDCVLRLALHSRAPHGSLIELDFAVDPECAAQSPNPPNPAGSPASRKPRAMDRAR